jgi:hypothetical protein
MLNKNKTKSASSGINNRRPIFLSPTNHTHVFLLFKKSQSIIIYLYIFFMCVCGGRKFLGNISNKDGEEEREIYI